VGTVGELAQKVRQALAVDAQYEGITIPSGIRRVMRRLLRDYNFPKSVKRYTSPATTLNQVSYTLPDGMKRPLEVRFFDPVAKTWTIRLERREGFSLPYTDSDVEGRYGRYFWLEGNNLLVDTPMPVAGLQMIVWYQSQLVDAATETWMLDDMEDIIFSMSVMKLAAELRKPEVMQAFAPLVGEEMTSIAIYANELEWNGLQMQMREPRGLPSARYPAQVTG